MDLLETIFTRRSIRGFKNKKVPKKTVRQILEAGLRAPSSKNSNPWHFLVLDNKKDIENIYIKLLFNQLFFIFGLYHDLFPIIELNNPESLWK